MITLSTKDFEQGGMIPSRFTCDENSERPTLSITGTNTGAKSFAIIVDDPDAPNGDFVHWVVFNIPPDTTEIGAALPVGATEGQNSVGKTGWIAPCPPSGMHHYHFNLYVLDTVLILHGDAKKSDVMAAIAGHILEKTEIMGLYTRK